MNAITHKAAYALYPKATFEEKLGLVTTKKTARRDDAIQKYVDRGWKFIDAITAERRVIDSFRYGKRWVSDNQTWILPLDASAGTAVQHDDLFTNGSFNLYYNNGATRRGSEMRFVPVSATASLPLVLNEECAVKVNAYIKLVTELYGANDGWDPDFYTEDRHSIEEDVKEWIKLCKEFCNCKYGSGSELSLSFFICRSLSNRCRYSLTKFLILRVLISRTKSPLARPSMR